MVFAIASCTVGDRFLPLNTKNLLRQCSLNFQPTKGDAYEAVASQTALSHSSLRAIALTQRSPFPTHPKTKCRPTTT
ncbi:hypothetical protein [Microcoleus sp. D2_18a_D3]|uniref:hypothetical protein n=1 Tax=Microcoleus sp. D2_18a_D3 TaxID=3055330 RepID=UPI002FCF8B28